MSKGITQVVLIGCSRSANCRFVCRRSVNQEYQQEQEQVCIKAIKLFGSGLCCVVLCCFVLCTMNYEIHCVMYAYRYPTNFNIEQGKVKSTRNLGRRTEEQDSGIRIQIQDNTL